MQHRLRNTQAVFFLLTQTLLFQVEIIQQGYNGSVPNSFVAAALQSCGFES
jgi:hypothetical protein